MNKNCIEVNILHYVQPHIHIIDTCLLRKGGVVSYIFLKQKMAENNRMRFYDANIETSENKKKYCKPVLERKQINIMAKQYCCVRKVEFT